MTDEALLQLALQACHDRTAQQVLGDAVLGSGWSDARVSWLLQRQESPSFLHFSSGTAAEPMVRTRSIRRAANLSRKNASNPTRRWCRAVAAVLLLGDWDTTRWPLAQRAYVDPFVVWWQGSTPPEMYGDDFIVRTGTFFGINRVPDPLRLAGIRLETGSPLRTLRDRVEQVSNLRNAEVISDEQARDLIDSALRGVS